MSNNYTLGQLIYRIIQFNEAQTRRPEDNHINFWKTFVHEFFAENAVYKYSILVEKDLKPFVLPVRLLPRYFKSCYADSLRSSSCVLDNPREFSTEASMYFLDCPSARIISVFDDSQICTFGTLRVTFNLNLKIHSFEFDAHRHVEYSSRSSIEERIASLIRNLTTIASYANDQRNTNDNYMEDHKPVAKKSRTIPDSECNGVLDTNNIKKENHANSDHHNHTHAHHTTNNNSFHNNSNDSLDHEGADGTREADGNGTLNATEIVNQVCTNLQTTFTATSPVNEYGVTSQVMRCFEISEIFLSMEDLMDYCLQVGCSPKNAMALYVNSHLNAMSYEQQPPPPPPPPPQ